MPSGLPGASGAGLLKGASMFTLASFALYFGLGLLAGAVAGLVVYAATT